MITALHIAMWIGENQATVSVALLIFAVVVAVAVTGHLANKHGWNERMKQDTARMKQERRDRNDRR